MVLIILKQVLHLVFGVLFVFLIFPPFLIDYLGYLIYFMTYFGPSIPTQHLICPTLKLFEILQSNRISDNRHPNHIVRKRPATINILITQDWKWQLPFQSRYPQRS